MSSIASPASPGNPPDAVLANPTDPELEGARPRRRGARQKGRRGTRRKAAERGEEIEVTRRDPTPWREAGLSGSIDMGNVVRASGFAKPGRHRVGERLYLQVTQSGVKSWVFRYKFGGAERQMGLGPLRHASVSEAKRCP